MPNSLVCFPGFCLGLKEGVTDISFAQGRLLVGVGRALRIYDMGKKQLLRKCENKSFPYSIRYLHVEGDRIVVGDLAESFHFAKYRRGENSLFIFADDATPRWLTATQVFFLFFFLFSLLTFAPSLWIITRWQALISLEIYLYVEYRLKSPPKWTKAQQVSVARFPTNNNAFHARILGSILPNKEPIAYQTKVAYFASFPEIATQFNEVALLLQPTLHFIFFSQPKKSPQKSLAFMSVCQYINVLQEST